jgi:hypothetical protein
MNSCDGSTQKLDSRAKSHSRTYTLLAGLSMLLISSGCYTQFGSNKGDYWNYTGTPQTSAPQAATAQREQVQVVERTTDTVTPSEQSQPMALLDTVPAPATTTVINNYYYDDSWRDPWWNRYGWDHYYRHHGGATLTIVIGDPYWADPWHPAYYNDYRYDHNWYWADDYWYHPTYRGPGWVTWDPYYPYPPYPFYGCYQPSYYYDDPYWWPHHDYWNGGYYGGHGYGGHGYAQTKSNVRTGRIGGGERRGPEAQSGGGQRINQAAAVDDARNAPVHVSAPNESSTSPSRAGMRSNDDVTTTGDVLVSKRTPEASSSTVATDPSGIATETPTRPIGRSQPSADASNESVGTSTAPTRARSETPSKSTGNSTSSQPVRVTTPPPDQPERAATRTRRASSEESESRPAQTYHEPEHHDAPARDEGRSESRPTNSGSSSERGSSERGSSDRGSGSGDHSRSSGRAR